MKSLRVVSLLFFFALFSITIFAAESETVIEKESYTEVNEQSNINVVQAKETLKKLTIKERFLKKKLSKILKRNNHFISPPEDDEVLLVILAILLPPLAVYMLEGLTDYFWIDLILTILGWVPGVIFALYLILR